MVRMKTIEKLRGSPIFKNTFLSLASKAVAMIFYFTADILVARILPVNEYGEWSFFYSTISIAFWIVLFGINTSSKVYIAGSREDSFLQGRYIRASVMLRFLVSLTFVFVFAAGSRPLADLWGYPEKYPHLSLLLLAGSLHLFTYSFCDYFKELYVGLVNFKNIFWLTLTEFGGYLVFGVGFLLVFSSVVALELAYIAATGAAMLLGFFFLKKCSVPKKSEPGTLKNLMFAVLKYSLPILVASAGISMIWEIDTVMIGMLGNGEDVAYYAVAKNLCSKATHISFAICTGTMTPFALINRENAPEKSRLFRRLIGLNGILILFVSAMFLLLGPVTIKTLYGPGFVNAITILIALIPAYMAHSQALFFSALLDYQKRALNRFVCFCVVLVLKILLNVILLPQYGSLGAAFATSAALVAYVLMLGAESVKIFRKSA